MVTSRTSVPPPATALTPACTGTPGGRTRVLQYLLPDESITTMKMSAYRVPNSGSTCCDLAGAGWPLMAPPNTSA